MSFCVICTDVFDGVECLNAAPCGHVFHSKCISRWVDEGGTCPECRRKLKRRDLLLLFFNVNSKNLTINPSGHKELESLKTQLKQKEKELAKQTAKVKDLRDLVVKNEENIAMVMQELTVSQMELQASRLSTRNANSSMEHSAQKIRRLELRNESLCKELELLNDVKTVVSGMQTEAEKIFREVDDQAKSGIDCSRKLATLCSILKRELHRAREEKDNLRNHVAGLKKDYGLRLAKAKCYKCERKDTQNSPSTDAGYAKLKNISHSPQNKKSSSSAMTPVSFERADECKLTVVNLNKDEISVSIPALKSRKHKLAPIVTQKKDKDSVSTTGYNGFGGHSTVIQLCIDLPPIRQPEPYKGISLKKRKMCKP